MTPVLPILALAALGTVALLASDAKAKKAAPIPSPEPGETILLETRLVDGRRVIIYETKSRSLQAKAGERWVLTVSLEGGTKEERQGAADEAKRESGRLIQEIGNAILEYLDIRDEGNRLVASSIVRFVRDTDTKWTRSVIYPTDGSDPIVSRVVATTRIVSGVDPRLPIPSVSGYRVRA